MHTHIHTWIVKCYVRFVTICMHANMYMHVLMLKFMINEHAGIMYIMNTRDHECVLNACDHECIIVNTRDHECMISETTKGDED